MLGTMADTSSDKQSGDASPEVGSQTAVADLDSTAGESEDYDADAEDGKWLQRGITIAIADLAKMLSSSPKPLAWYMEKT